MNTNDKNELLEMLKNLDKTRVMRGGVNMRTDEGMKIALDRIANGDGRVTEVKYVNEFDIQILNFILDGEVAIAVRPDDVWVALKDANDGRFYEPDLVKNGWFDMNYAVPAIARLVREYKKSPAWAKKLVKGLGNGDFAFVHCLGIAKKMSADDVRVWFEEDTKFGRTTKIVVRMEDGDEFWTSMQKTSEFVGFLFDKSLSWNLYVHNTKNLAMVRSKNGDTNIDDVMVEEFARVCA